MQVPLPSQRDSLLQVIGHNPLAPTLPHPFARRAHTHTQVDAFGMPLSAMAIALPGQMPASAQQAPPDEPPGHRYVFDEDTGMLITTGKPGSKGCWVFGLRPSTPRGARPPACTCTLVCKDSMQSHA